MAEPRAEREGLSEFLAEMAQMCAAPSSGYSAGAWCEAANHLLQALTAAEKREAELREALAQLRLAWNAHMDRCGLPAVPGMTNEEFFAKIAEWKDAPSNTASALQPPGEDE